jgi:acyl carrier protein
MKITPSVLSKVFKRIPRQAVIYQYDLDYTKTYSEQGLDDLDIIEMVMYIERELNISIHDELTDTIFSIDSYPINFTLWHRPQLNIPENRYAPCLSSVFQFEFRDKKQKEFSQRIIIF